EQHVAGKTDEQFARESAAYQREADGYNAAVAALKAENPDISFAEITRRVGAFPWPPPWGRTMLRRPAGPFETMLTRVAPVTLRGFLFYQGEQDATPARAPGYAALLTTMIAQWRALFGDETLFFTAAQLPRFGAEPSLEDWPAIRAAQQAVVDRTDNAALACLLDCGERDNVHPTDRRTPGKRLAAVALAHVYGQSVPADAPRLAGAALEGDRLLLRFAHAGGGLRVPEHITDAFCVEGAALAGVSANGEALALELLDAGQTVRVRYAQKNWPDPILMGQNDLPVFPFVVELERST
ncbi:MAG: sialate O-acetylesterase, partial [Candidatus Ventricola sp.]